MNRNFLIGCLALSLLGCGQQEHESPVAQSESSSPQAAVNETPETPAASYEELLERASTLVKSGDINAAVKALSQAISQDSQQTEAFVKRATICAEAKLFSQAILDMTAAIKLDPENAKFLNTRGYFYLLNKQYERAESDFSDAIGLDLQYPQPYNNRGLVCVAQRRFEEAVKNFDHALRVKPDYPDALNNRGFALLQMGKTEEAIQSFSQVLELDPRYLNALTNRARAYLKLEKANEAVLDFTKAIELQPDHAPHYLARAEAYGAAGNSEAASRDRDHVAWLRKLGDLNLRLSRSPRDADLWAQLGRHLLIESRLKEAEKSFEKALNLVPAHPQALLGRAQMFLEAGRYEDVIRDCTELLNREYSYETCSLRGDAYFALGKYGEAIADYESARRFDEQVVTAYRMRAEQLRKNGDDRLAAADEKMAATLEKRMTEAEQASTPAAPRKLVIEQASYDEPATTSARPTPPEK